MFRGLTSVFYKEILQISRDPFTLVLMLLVPMFQLLIFGYAINTDVRNIPTAAYNLDPGPLSRKLLQAFENTDYFRIREQVGSDADLDHAIRKGSVKVGIKIPPDYSARLEAGRPAPVLVLIDGSDSSVATQSMTVSTSVGLSQSMARLLRPGGIARPRPDIPGGELPIEIRPQLLYNPDARSANFMVPGLIAIILQIITTLLTAFSIVRERERGTLEQLFITPVRPFGLMLGKLIPYGIIGFVETCSVLLAMRFVFGVPIHGSLPLLLSLCVLFLIPGLAIGLFISTKAQNQVQALQLAWLIMLPSVLLSGFMFPRESMPLAMRAVGYAIPATHFMDILRGIILRGATLADLLPQTLTLAAMGAAFLAFSALRFRKQIG